MYHFEKNQIARIIFTLILVSCHISGAILLAETTPPPPPPVLDNNGNLDPDDPEGLVQLPNPLSTWFDDIMKDGTVVMILDFSAVEDPGEIMDWLSLIDEFRNDWLANADGLDTEIPDEGDELFSSSRVQPKPIYIHIRLPGLYAPDWADQDR